MDTTPKSACCECAKLASVTRARVVKGGRVGGGEVENKSKGRIHKGIVSISFAQGVDLFLVRERKTVINLPGEVGHNHIMMARCRSPGKRDTMKECIRYNTCVNMAPDQQKTKASNH